MVFQLPTGIRGHGKGTDGMLTTAEGEFLAEKATNKIVLELGSWCGLSTITMAKTAAHVYACDWHQGDPEMGRQHTLGEMYANVMKFDPNHDKITILVGRFPRILPILREETFDMIYIDGAHDYHSVYHDTMYAKSLVIGEVHGGLICWHDGDRSVVQDAVRANSLQFEYGPDRIIWAQV